MTAFMIAAAFVALSARHAYRLAVPSRTDLVASVGHWDRARSRATRGQLVGTVAPTTAMGKVGSWLGEQLVRRGRDLTGLMRDLAITESTLEQHLTKTATLAAVGLVAPTAIFTTLSFAGLGVPLAFGPVCGLALAAAMIATASRELRETARRRRAEFRRALSIYLDLVAMSMEAGRGHAEALPASAEIGTGWGFTHIQDAVEGARFAGTTAWAALGELGERIGIRELTDLDASLRLTNDDGAKVRATLVARAKTLRAQRIADAEAACARATESMKFALIAMVFVFLTYELYPSVARLFAG